MKNLQYIFQTKSPVYILLSSGTGAMETAVTNFLSFQDKIIVINAGKFGERWAHIARKYNITVFELNYAWGQEYNLNDIKKLLTEHPEIRAVYTQLCETSTGVIMNIKKLGNLCKNRPCLLVVDAISGLGAVEFHMDQWSVDVTISASQKALMTPPGLGFISFNKKALHSLKRSNIPGFYYDLNKYIKSGQKYAPPFTPNITGVVQLNKALEIIKKQGIKAVIHKHTVFACAVRKAVKAMGLKLLNKKNTGNVCTSVLLPEKINAREFLNLLKNRFQVILAPGQGEYKNKMVRIGHLGFLNKEDIITGLSAMEKGLGLMKIKITPGKAAAVIEKELKNI